MRVAALRSIEEYRRHVRRTPAKDLSFEKTLLPEPPADFTFRGYCHVCREAVDFIVDYRHALQIDGRPMPNWRERLVCPGCGLNNRLRATVHVFEQVARPHPDAAIYLTEQVTPLYTWFRKAFPSACGSEFLGEAVPPGGVNERGVRNEDLTGLSFEPGSFNFILSFDVFEHVPDYRKALAECLRCLKPGGMLFFSVPFNKDAAANLERARVAESGDIEHLLPPEYHGDPLRAGGCLCFRHFGWALLDDLQAAGFVRSRALLYWSKELGYLGKEQVFFTARKPRR